MSDQLFLGLSPKSPAGKEYLFFSLDDWIEIDRFIWSTVLGEYPDHPTWDAETAERLAEELQMRIARCQLPWPVGVNYPGRWKRGMMGLAFRL